MNIKKINLVLIYTLLVFSLFTFSVYPKSHAKYFKEDNPLVYDLGLLSLYKGYNDTLAFVPLNTTYEKVTYQFNFDRSTLIKKQNESLMYRIVVDNNCNIESISSRADSTRINGNEATIRYNDNEEDNIIVKYSCAVNDLIVTQSGDKYLKINYNIYETYYPDNIEYLYTYGLNALSLYPLDEFYLRYPIPNGIISDDKKTLIIPGLAKDKYETFVSWVDIFAKEYLSDIYDISIIKKYVLETFVDEEAILGSTYVLNGLTMEYDDENDNYIYTIDDNLIGYAKTYFESVPYKMYFSNINATDLELTEIFEYYLNTYLYPGDNESMMKLLNYVNDNGGISSIIKDPNKTIAGLSYEVDSGLVRINQNILVIINAINSSPIELPYLDNLFLMNMGFNDAIHNAYPDIINQYVLDYIGINIEEIVTYREKTKEQFDVYVIVDIPDSVDTEGNTITYDPLLFHMYSNYDADDPETHYNYVKVTRLITDMEIELDYSIVAPSEHHDDLTDMINDLNSINTVLNQSHVFDSNQLLPTNGDGTYVDGEHTDGYYTTIVDNTNNKVTVKFKIQ